MRTILTLMIVALFTACNKDDENVKTAIFLDTSVEISLKTADGEDLLNPTNPNAYKSENIKIYYLIDGEKQEVYDGNMDYPRNFLVYENANDYRIRIFQNSSITEELPITYVEWNENETDTLQAEYYRPKPNEPRVQKVWFNGELKWDSQDGKEGFFTIVK